MDQEQALQYLKEGFKEKVYNNSSFFLKALSYKDINMTLMEELENVFLKNKCKSKRVLFIRN